MRITYTDEEGNSISANVTEMYVEQNEDTTLNYSTFKDSIYGRQIIKVTEGKR